MANKIGISNLGLDGMLTAAGHLTTLKMRRFEDGPTQIIRVWENGTWSADVSPERAQEILDTREANGYEDKIGII